MTIIKRHRRLRAGFVALAAAVGLSGCGFSPYKLPLPGGADLGDNPYTIKVEFRDVLDLVPQSGVRVNDVAVGKITEIELKDWTALVTLQVNGKTELPDNAVASIRQTSLLGEKFVSLAPPEENPTGRLSNGDLIPLERSGRNPEIEEVFSAASLLLNGGGLDKTNTIVRELGKTLDGNEPEVKELLQSTNTFLGQLDANKEGLLTALEKVNRLAIATNGQKAAITNALDDLPEALSVINNQRDDLVKLLRSLDNLGDVATGVIRRSKADTLENLDNLEPVLRELANAGDSLAEATQILLSFPFSDALVGNSVSRAMVSCSDDSDTVVEKVHNGACYGDYANLDINLTLNTQQAVGLLGGILSLGCAQLPAGSCPEDLLNIFSGFSGLSAAADPGKTKSPNPLPDLTQGLVPNDAGSSSGSNDAKAPPVVCSLLGLCRTPAASLAEAQKSDIGRLLVGPAVAR